MRLAADRPGVGFLMGDGTRWRDGQAQAARRSSGSRSPGPGCSFARLAVQLPLYFAGNVDGARHPKLLMGLPLFAPLVAVTWLAVRALYPALRRQVIHLS